ncbi:MAG: DUF362 domain-containing protein, partial [Candidatus Omnitrophota bacterium]
KLKNLVSQSKVLDFVCANSKVAVKIHFGEEDNTGYIRPEYAAVVCQELKSKKAIPFLSDSNTLYRGKRTNSGDHLKLAYEHGFLPDKAGAEVLIPDDTKKENSLDFNLNARFVKIAKISRIFDDAQALVGLAHFKGHIMTGFGGALKNIGMGCASRQGKLAQHGGMAPVVIKKKCTGCRACENVCPVGAVTIFEKKSDIDAVKCIGCASCIAACEFSAIEVNWEAGGDLIQEKMVEYAMAVLGKKKGRAVFFNFAIKITKECDCLAKDDPRISPDIGIFVSSDPVAVDKASFDSVVRTNGRDIFRDAHPKREGLKQLYYAQQLGLGSIEYDLIRI